MLVQVSATPTVAKSAATDATARHLADFHPDVWGDRFLSYASQSKEMDEDAEEKIQKLKEQVKEMLTSAENASTKLNLIDLIQRLGLSYHFESKIETTFQHLHQKHCDNDEDDDLHIVALRLRLLRECGFNVSSDVLKKFRDEEGKFKEYLIQDTRGMLSLYEAANMRFHGENLLEDALTFTHMHLQSIASDSSHPLADQVSDALLRPLRKRLPRLEARRFMSLYQDDPSHNEVLLTLAKLDFNMLQKLHQKELSTISRWWKDMDLARKLPFIRDRSVENYFWMLGMYFEPQYSLARIFSTKVIIVTSIIDDVFDAYGTLEELIAFANAVERWDNGCLDQHPEYLKLCYKTLTNVYEEIERELSKQGISYSLHYAKESMNNLVQAYLVEAKWLNENYVPTTEEYMQNALVSCGYLMLTITSFLGMGHIANEEAFRWASESPKIIQASSVICRLMDDIASHEFEQIRGHVASSVECYMREYGVSGEEACAELNKQIASAWTDINEEMILGPTNVSMPLLMRVINLARVMDLLYKDGDEYTHVGNLMKSCIAALLIDPVTI